MGKATRPRVVCHMVASVDGRIVVEGWPEAVSAAVRRQYEELHASYAAEGWLCGRITMAAFVHGTRSAAEIAGEHHGPARDDFVAPGEHASFAWDARAYFARARSRNLAIAARNSPSWHILHPPAP